MTHPLSDPEHVTSFPEDDNPLQHAGAFAADLHESDSRVPAPDDPDGRPHGWTPDGNEGQGAARPQDIRGNEL